MTYTDSGVYVVQTTSALEARKAIRPETLAIELDPRYCSVQRGDALRFTTPGTTKTWNREVTWTLPIMDGKGRLVSIVAGLGDTIDEGEATS